MANFYALFETVLITTIQMMEVEVLLPIRLDVGDEGSDPNFAAGVAYDTETGEKYLLFNATSPWWREGDLKQKMLETVRHEIRHLFQEQYLIDHYGFDKEICNFLMGTHELYGGYEMNPYEVDAHRFETSGQAFDEGLDWIDQIVAH